MFISRSQRNDRWCDAGVVCWKMYLSVQRSQFSFLHSSSCCGLSYLLGVDSPKIDTIPSMFFSLFQSLAGSSSSSTLESFTIRDSRLFSMALGRCIVLFNRRRRRPPLSGLHTREDLDREVLLSRTVQESTNTLLHQTLGGTRSFNCWRRHPPPRPRFIFAILQYCLNIEIFVGARKYQNGGLACYASAAPAEMVRPKLPINSRIINI